MGKSLVNVKKLNGFVSVKDFGAVGDGVTDDSASFSAAFSSGAKCVVVPTTSKYYLLSDITLPSGVELRGEGRRRVYNPSSLADMEGTGCLVFKTTGSFLMSFSGNNTVRNLNFYGVNKTCDGLGVTTVGGHTFYDCGFHKFDKGIGTDAGYIGSSKFFNCNASQNTTGIRNFVDSHFYGCVVNANSSTGVSMLAGANDNTFVGLKVEWNEGSNWVFYQALNNTVVGGVTDRSGGSYGMDVRQSHLTVNGTIFRRSGKDDASTSSHFVLGSNEMVTLNGVLTKTGPDDGGGGNTTPNYIFTGVDSSSGPLLINGCDLSGYTTGLKTGSTLDVIYSGSYGKLDNLRSIVSSSGTATSGGGTFVTTASGIELDALSTNTSAVRRYKVQVQYRDASTGEVGVNDFMVKITRGGAGGAAATVYEVSDRESTSINDNAEATVNVTLTNVAADATSFEVTSTNTGGTNLTVSCQVLPVN